MTTIPLLAGVAILLAVAAHAGAQIRRPEVRVEAEPKTLLNSDTRVESASLLGLTPRLPLAV